jgi:hypothetical protein
MYTTEHDSLFPYEPFLLVLLFSRPTLPSQSSTTTTATPRSINTQLTEPYHSAITEETKEDLTQQLQNLEIPQEEDSQIPPMSQVENTTEKKGLKPKEPEPYDGN